MNIYIRLEVRTRELEARLLLAMVAAERGHEVLLGELRPLLNHRVWLPPGLYHDKSLTPAPRRLALHRRLVAAGMVISSQDEEHGLLQPDYGPFAAQRFSDESLKNAKAVMAWGEHDATALMAAYPKHASRIHRTGSPRVDLWRPELAELHRVPPPEGPDPSGPYVLYASNVMVTNRNPFWVALRAQRPTYFRGPDDSDEFAQYRASGAEFLFLEHAVRTVRMLARALPGVKVIVRPHPTEAEGAWEDLLGPVDGVTVTRRGALGPWVRGAVCVLHNGSTSALEAAVAGTPVVSLIPDGWRSDLLTNRLGPNARDPEGVVRQVRRFLSEPEARTWEVEAARAHLAGVLDAIEGPLAADRIVDVWDEATGEVSGGTPVRWSDLLAGRAHHAAGRIRIRARRAEDDTLAFETAHKFPPLDRRQLDAIAIRLRGTLNRFSKVRVELIGPRLIRVRPGKSRED